MTSRMLSGLGLAVTLGLVVTMSACSSTPEEGSAPADETGTKTVLTVATPGALVPYLFQNEDSQAWEGANAEMLDFVLGKAGYEYVVEDMAFENIIPAIETGRVDFSTNIYNTEARRDVLDFINFYQGPFALVTNAENASKISSWSDICGEAVATNYAATIAQVIEEYNAEFCADNPVINQEQSGSYADLLRQVQNGQAIGAMDDSGIYGYLIKDQPSMKLALKEVGPMWQWGVSFSNDNPLADELEPYFQEFLDSDLPAQLAEKWGLNGDLYSKDATVQR